MTSGRTWPSLITCERNGGEEVELIAKFAACCDRGPSSLIAEAVAASLAVDLGLPVSEPVVVGFDDEFVDLMEDCDRELAAKLRGGITPAFGSTKLPPGFMPLPQGKKVPSVLQSQAAEIFAFDALVQNSDRRPENPNCLLGGDSLAIFDHELCFLTEGIIGWEPPWVVGALNTMRNRHLFYRELAGKPNDLSRFYTAWQNISDERLLEYAGALPQEWVYNNDTATKILDYVTEVRDNIDPSILEIERVLS
jgi:hypothetical protein